MNRSIGRIKFVPRMDSLSPGLQASLNDLVHDQITLVGRRRSYTYSFVSNFDMFGSRISLAVHGDSLDTETVTRLDNPACNLT